MKCNKKKFAPQAGSHMYPFDRFHSGGVEGDTYTGSRGGDLWYETFFKFSFDQVDYFGSEGRVSFCFTAEQSI